MSANFSRSQCVDEIMEDMPERDLLPKNVMKVPEVFHYIVDHHKGRRWRRGGGGEGEEGKGKEVRREEEGRRGREYIFSALSQCLSVFVVM